MLQFMPPAPNVETFSLVQTFGRRLRAERERLSLSQAELGAVGGVQKLSQHLYETEERSPNAKYLTKLQEAGVDVAFVLFGKRASEAEPLTALDQELVDKVYENVERFGVDKFGAPLSTRERSKLFTFLYTVAASTTRIRDIEEGVRRFTGTDS